MNVPLEEGLVPIVAQFEFLNCSNGYLWFNDVINGIVSFVGFKYFHRTANNNFHRGITNR
jgi:ligand-binding sensor domain-containing protein